MTVRVALLADTHDKRHRALWGALEAGMSGMEIQVVRTGPGLAGRAPDQATVLRRPALGRMPMRSLVRLAAFRPDLVISEDFGAAAVQAALYRAAVPRSRLLVCATEPPPRFGLRERLILRQADGVLADGEGTAQAMAQFSVPPARIFPFSTPYDVECFLACGRTRVGPSAHRLIFAGNLTPQSGAADLLIALAVWAEQNPERPVEIWWAGDGDLAGVLGAQPLPGTISQRFLGRLDPPGLAAAFGECGLLVVPSLTNARRAPVLEALAAGLPVLGSRLNRRARQLVRDGANGWLFDPLQPGDIVRALGRALSMSAEQLDQMRDRARASTRPAASRGFADRLRGIFASVMADPALAGAVLAGATIAETQSGP